MLLLLDSLLQEMCASHLSCLLAALLISGGNGSPEWVELCGQDSLYLVSEDTKTWYDAADNCELYGGYLAQIDSQEENFCLLEHLSSVSLGRHFWHSANDIGVEGVIRQGDGRGPSAGGYLPWTPRFYDNNHGGGEGRSSNCYYLVLNAPQHAGLWDDVDCLLSDNYICERTVPPTANK